VEVLGLDDSQSEPKININTKAGNSMMFNNLHSIGDDTLVSVSSPYQGHDGSTIRTGQMPIVGGNGSTIEYQNNFNHHATQ
jgi:hypothetical protein